MSREPRTLRRALGIVALAGALATGAGVADEWLVYIDGGIEPIEGGWYEQEGQVVFTLRGGTLVSVPFHDVDLPTSVFITWQLGGRRRVPPRAAVPQTEPEGAGPAPPCADARVLAVNGGETLEILTEDTRETVHLACLDAPETQHRFAELGWFGRATLSAVELSVKPGDGICVTELVPPLRDGAGHRIVYVKLADGRDYTASVIAGGLGLLRPGPCGRAEYYRKLEDRAIAEQRGLWGPVSQRAAFRAANHAPAVSAGPPPPRSAGGG